MAIESTETGPTNGAAAAAILAVAIGILVLGASALAGDASATAARWFNVWKPTGPLSGVTMLAILVWLGAWFGFARIWRRRNLNLGRINLVALVLIIMGLLLTIPPFVDLLQGK